MVIQSPNPIEVDARIAALEQQRNAALSQAVLLAGQLAVLQQQLQMANQKIEELQKAGSINCVVES